MRECNCLETHIPRNGHTLWPSECDDYAFCKVCDDSFSIAHGEGNDVRHESRLTDTSRIEQAVETNLSIRPFLAASSKTADSKPVSVTRAEVVLCELIVEQNISLAKMALPSLYLLVPMTR